MKKRLTYQLTLSYDGTNYSGWQIQPEALSIQWLVQNSLKTILREEISLVGAGRTDAGVHALGQEAHFTVENPCDPYRIVYALNSLLPHDIRVLSLKEVLSTFHARYSAKGKIYRYHLHLDPIPDPFQRFYRLHVRRKIDLDLLKAGALHFLGKKDFTSFAAKATEGCASRNPIKTLRRLDVVSEPGGLYLEFEGDGFLYKMVRNIVGTLLDVGTKKMPANKIEEIFEKRDRKQAGRTAPPHGLFLVKVLY